MIHRISKYSPILLRTGVAIVFLWFGFSQIKNPSSWTALLPNFMQSLPLSVNFIIYINGAFEILFASMLLLGVYTRFVSLILGLHLLHITTILGYGSLAVRDFALALATLSIFLHGADEFCLDYILKKEQI